MALCVWPFIHPFNFRFVPIQHRLLVLNVCSLGVFSYATFVSEKKTDAAAAAVLFDAGEGHGNGRPSAHGADTDERGSAMPFGVSDASAQLAGDLATCDGMSTDDVVAELLRLDGRLEAVEGNLGCYSNDFDTHKTAILNH
jgi:hypothetical protein|eukprot:COSAG02_NODE_7413_length_3027_cov_3.227117_2_plen_141_part_00